MGYHNTVDLVPSLPAISPATPCHLPHLYPVGYHCSDGFSPRIHIQLQCTRGSYRWYCLRWVVLPYLFLLRQWLGQWILVFLLDLITPALLSSHYLPWRHESLGLVVGVRECQLLNRLPVMMLRPLPLPSSPGTTLIPQPSTHSLVG